MNDQPLTFREMGELLARVEVALDDREAPEGLRDGVFAIRIKLRDLARQGPPPAPFRFNPAAVVTRLKIALARHRLPGAVESPLAGAIDEAIETLETFASLRTDEDARTKAPCSVISGPWLIHQLENALDSLPANVPTAARNYLMEIRAAVLPLVNPINRGLAVSRR